jgi:hypothetical protein
LQNVDKESVKFKLGRKYKVRLGTNCVFACVIILAYDAFSSSVVNLTLSTHLGNINISGPARHKLPHCCICSAVPVSLVEIGHQYAHSRDWFAISRTVPWSCIRKSCQLFSMYSRSTLTNKRCKREVRKGKDSDVICIYALTTHPRFTD